MKIGKTHRWWRNISKDKQLEIFRYWRQISISPRKALCLDEINESNDDINAMLDEISRWEKLLMPSGFSVPPGFSQKNKR